MSTETVIQTPDVFPDYEKWIERGRALIQSNSANSWNIGDWSIEGEAAFNVIQGIPRYVLIHKKNDGTGESYSEAVPNFWKMTAEVVGTSIGTLKTYKRCAQDYPPEKRFPQLSWSHHWEATVYGYDRRFDYLAACLKDLKPGERPRSVVWLSNHIMRCEGKPAEIETTSHVDIPIPKDTFARLKDLGKYYQRTLPELVQQCCNEAIVKFLEKEAEKIAITKYGLFEGRWPLGANAPKKLPRKRKHYGDPVVSERMRRMVITRWSRNQRIA